VLLRDFVENSVATYFWGSPCGVASAWARAGLKLGPAYFGDHSMGDCKIFRIQKD